VHDVAYYIRGFLRQPTAPLARKYLGIEEGGSGATGALGISAGGQSTDAGLVVFSNANNVSFGLNAGTLTASAGAAAGSVNFSAGTTSNNLTAVVFTNANGVSFGLNGSSIYYNVAQDCLVACPDGREFTVVIPAGTFSAKTQLAADARAEAYACLLAKANFICIGELDNPGMCVGSNYLETVEVTIPGGNFPTVVSVINGVLPPGISLDYTDTNFTLLGTPTSAGQYDFTIFVEDVLGNSMEKPFSLFVIEITQDTLPDGIVGSAYSQTMTLTGPTSGAVTWAVTAGFLPPGLTLNPSTGLLSGTPTSQGSATFTISGTDER